MGRKTWESLPKKPLPNRHNIILSRNVEVDKQIKQMSSENVSCFQSSQQALEFCKKNSFDEVWIIGGTEIYKHFYQCFTDDIKKIYITRVKKEYECDVYFPEISDRFDLTNCLLTIEYDEVTKENVEVEYQIYEQAEVSLNHNTGYQLSSYHNKNEVFFYNLLECKHQFLLHFPIKI